MKKTNEWLLLFSGCVLHILFSAEGIFYSWNWKYPLIVLGRMISFAIPGILVSLLVFVPILYYAHSKSRNKKPKLKDYVWAIYIGFIFRILL